MCKNVIIHYPNGKEQTCETQFQLLNEMSFGIDNGDDIFVGSSCLCNVNLDKTAILNGYICSDTDPYDTPDPFDLHFYKIDIQS